jgi:hypothetical protein
MHYEFIEIDKKTLQSLLKYSHPDVRRGPTYNEWLGAMQDAMSALDYPTCPRCKGNCCANCLFTGFINPEDL